MKSRFHHIHLICGALDEMQNFFIDVLGATLVTRMKFGDADGVKLELGGVIINLRVPDEGEQIVSDGGTHFGYDHICLEVEDLEKTYGDLTKKGFVFLNPPMQSRNVKTAFFKGPEDITIELLQVLG